MLKVNNYSAFKFAALYGHTEVLDFLWNKVELSEAQCAILEADNYVMFRTSAQEGHIGVLNFL
ncbi:MAG: hypothetical protein ACR5KX_06375 [Wolbachia sp.]